jgi:hypothetical protein
MDTPNLVLGLIAAVGVASTLGAMVLLIWATRPRRNIPDHTPPVSILKPLKGMDEGLEANLRGFFRLDYPAFQLLFGVADPDDPAIGVVQRLMAEFPEQDARLIVGTPAFGLNPKVENLAAMYPHVKHDVSRSAPPTSARPPATSPTRASAWSRTSSRASASGSWAPRWRTSSSTASSPATSPPRSR